MNRVVTAAEMLILLVLFTTTLCAQQPPVRRPGELSDEEVARGCASCGACGGVMILIPIVVIALNIALLVWVARDAKARGMDSAVLWMILVMFTSVIGFLIYLFSRPQGNLIQCRSCGNKRLQASKQCPHCGNA